MFIGIIGKYLNKNIVLVFLSVFAIISFIIFGNAFALTINKNIEHNLDISVLLALVVINFSKNLPLIIVISITLATTVVINKLYKNSEINTISSVGIGELGLFKNVSLVNAIVFIITIVLSMFVLPKLESIKQEILNSNIDKSNFNFVNNNQFQKFRDGNIILYNNNQSGQIAPHADNTFIYNKINDSIILAKDMQEPQDNNNQVYVNLTSGNRYQGILNDDGSITNFDKLSIKIFHNHSDKMAVKSQTRSIKTVIDSNNPADIAELQWRIAMPFSIFVLSFTAIVLAKVRPRTNKNFSLLFSLLFCVAYIYALKSAKNLIAEGNFDAYFIYFVHLLFLGVSLMLFFYKK